MSQSIRVLFAAAESVPFAKVGGMADVVGSLPAALRRLGVDARVILPGYGFIKHYDYGIQHLFTFSFTHRLGTAQVNVYGTEYDGVPTYFVQAYPYFGNDATVYSEWTWDVPRFIFFNQMVMATTWEMRSRLGWFPDAFHVNDWHSGLIPFLMEQNRYLPDWEGVASLLSIHNLAYQGDHAGGFLFEAGIYGRHHPDLMYQDLTDNMMGIAIAYSDILTTVSPRYAVEIQYPHMGYGLEGLVRRRVQDLHGILNGIDVEKLNPATDKHLAAKFSADDFEAARATNKAALQQMLGLPQRPDVPLFGLVSRLVYQKGIDLLIPAIYRIMGEYDVQFVALGTGEPQYEAMMRQLMVDFGWRGARALLRYNDGVAQQIYGGSDVFLMPSHFEPCGMGQMLAMRYGSLPLVRETGGLADTVENYDNGEGDRGTGFVFSWEESDAVYYTMRWAIETFYNRRSAWQRMQRRAMQTDFSWDKSAQQYKDLYQQAIARRRPGWNG
ncbi:MAG: glycogen synthase [Anaerolineae bacterium]|nr:glycogen synthase [Anaerolineae bacterium]